MGLVSLTVMVKILPAVVVWVVTPPEKKALSPLGTQGASKAAWATEWVVGKKWNSTWSPTAAVMFLGVKESPFLPTLTVWTEPEEEPVEEGVELWTEEEESVELESEEPYCAAARERRGRMVATVKSILTEFVLVVVMRVIIWSCLLRVEGNDCFIGDEDRTEEL
jgi:hypothetical protein